VRVMTHRRQDATDLAAVAEEAARSGAPAVAVCGCTKRYGTGAVAVDALRGVTLEVAPGEFVVILGRRGRARRRC
jgi:ABC-type glutathione transport system ATPase component